MNNDDELPITKAPSNVHVAVPPMNPASTGPSPKNKMIMIIIMLVMLIIAVFVIAWGINNLTTKTRTIIKSTSKTTSGTAKVDISASGFTPANLQVSVGTTVTWTNTDTAPHRVASDPYPSNDGLSGFDSIEAFQTNGTYTYKFEKAGTFGYHDQQKPFDFKGTVVVSPATTK